MADQEKKPSVGWNAAGSAGLGLMGASGVSSLAHDVIGAKKLYHGTSEEAASQILREGLQPRFGGSGAASVNPGFVENSKGFIHVTPRPIEAKVYAGLAHSLRQEGPIKEVGPGAMVEAIHRMANNIGKGKVLRAVLPSEQAAHFVLDPDSGALKSRTPVEAAAFTRGAGDVLKQRLTDRKGWATHLKKNAPQLVGATLGTAGLLGGAAYLGHRAWKAHQQEKQAADHGPKYDITFQGLTVAIENPKGSVRAGVDKDGKPWRTVMKAPYGFIRNTKGSDGEEVGAYVGPDTNAPTAYVVNQRKEDGKTFDEHKVMLGYKNFGQAVASYLQHYNDPKFLGPIKEVPVKKLRAMVENGDQLEVVKQASPLAALALGPRSVGAVSKAVRAPIRFQGLPGPMRSAIESSPMVKNLGISPANAFHLIDQSRKPGETAFQSMRRHLGPPAGAAAEAIKTAMLSELDRLGGSGAAFLEKDAVSNKWVGDRIRHAADGVPSKRLLQFSEKMLAAERKHPFDSPMQAKYHSAGMQGLDAAERKIRLEGLDRRFKDLSEEEQRSSWVGKAGPVLGTVGGTAGAGYALHRHLKNKKKGKEKTAAISEEQARRSLDRLDSLEQNKPSGEQVARYGAIGALAAPSTKMVGNLISGKKVLDFGQHVSDEAKLLRPASRFHPGGSAGTVLRGAGALATGGAIMAGAVPLLRNHFDRKAEIGKLQQFVAQHQEGQGHVG